MSDEKIEELVEEMYMLYLRWLDVFEEVMETLHDIYAEEQDKEKAVEEGRKLAIKHKPLFTKLVRGLVDKYGLSMVLDAITGFLHERVFGVLYECAPILLTAKSRRARFRLLNVIDQVWIDTLFACYLLDILSKITEGEGGR